MASFKIEIACDDADFTGPKGEGTFLFARWPLYLLLSHVADRVEGGEAEGAIRSVDGNTVGHFLYSAD